jgi:AcrR family transcriptional regulator
MKTQAAAVAAKPYHHGDLRRALLDAALTIIEREGPEGLSLRAVAREAGVSPAAPYHHFKDKSDLLGAVSEDGFKRLKVAMATSTTELGPGAMGVAYVRFAHQNPALYRVMYDCARSSENMPHGHDGEGDDGFKLLKDKINKSAGGNLEQIDLELAAIASWCAVHGLAEISTFQQFQPLKEALGGEDAFVRAVLDHLGMFKHPG